MTEKEIFEAAIATYGEKSQKLMLIEEMSELTKEICKDFRRQGNITAIAEEIADVEIMLEQAKMIYSADNEFYKLVDAARKYKVDRLKKRLGVAEK